MQDTEVIHSYSREEAINDGVLLDATEMAKEAGIRYPVAITRELWETYILPDPRAEKHGQSWAARLWDVLSVFRMVAARSSKDIIYFRVYFIMKERQKRQAILKAICGPGDTPEPVITIMLPHED